MTYIFDYISPELREIIEPAAFHSHRFEKKLGFKVLSNAFLAPYFSWDRSIGCIIDENGHVVKDSECLEWKEDENYYNVSDAAIKSKKVIYLGFLVTVFGHSFTDNFRKLWFLDTDECKRLIADGWELVYTTSWNRALPDYVREFNRLAGFDLSPASRITEVTRYDKVCVPDNCVIAGDCGREFCTEYIKIIERIKNNVPIGSDCFGSLYFSRTKYSKGSRKEYGEREIERAFKRAGYTIVYPEDHSLEEQLQMVQNCTSFAATEGSVSHLSVFCKPGTNVILINKANYLNFHQVMINECANLNVTYIEAHHSSKANSRHPWWGPFYLCVNGYLEHFMRRRIIHLPFWLRVSYWKYSKNILYKCCNRARKIVNAIIHYSFHGS